MTPFIHQFRVRYAELDPQSVVFNARYLEYADVIVSEFFRERRAAGADADMEYHVRRAEVDYLAPMRFEELVTGQLEVTRIGNSSMVLTITLFGQGSGFGQGAGAGQGAGHGKHADSGSHDPHDVRAIINLVQVHVDLASGKPLPIPDSVRAAFGFPAQSLDADPSA
jgi:acyl-CoA thioester hydrolase